MLTLEELLKKKERAEEVSDLPIEDFVDWGGWIGLIDSHIEALKPKEDYWFDEKIKDYHLAMEENGKKEE